MARGRQGAAVCGVFEKMDPRITEAIEAQGLLLITDFQAF